jgi:hypothetical protein
MNRGRPHVSTTAPATTLRSQIGERRPPLLPAPVAGELQRKAARLNRRIIAITQTLTALLASAFVGVLAKLALRDVPPFTFVWLQIAIGGSLLTLDTFPWRGERIPICYRCPSIAWRVRGAAWNRPQSLRTHNSAVCKYRLPTVCCSARRWPR